MREYLHGPAVPSIGFDYTVAFGRNIGWLTEWEQQELRKKTIAIAGLGGVGGVHALTLARLGIGGFHIADLDRFDLANFNRQIGAFVSTLHIPKTAVIAQMLRDINPGIRLSLFEEGVRERNLDEFLSGIDLFVDGFDFFAINIRRKCFARCADLGIPAITAAPLGFGASYLIFMPGGMTFENYFCLDGLTEEQQYVNLALGLAPKGYHRSYLIDPSRLDLAHHRGPSTAAAVQLCAGVAGTEALKILLRRGKVRAAPWYHHFDAFRCRWAQSRLRFGNAGPLQSLKRQLAYRLSSRLSRNAWPPDPPAGPSDIEQILDLARWAPSGDNVQPWRFEITGDDTVILHVRVQSETQNIYEYASGQPTFLSAGFLLQTIQLAASRFQRSARWAYLGSQVDKCGSAVHRIRVMLPKAEGIIEDPLSTYIRVRSVDRRPYEMRRLNERQRKTLANALGELKIEWRETARQRWRLARLCARATDIRLKLYETYAVHRRVLDWDRSFSSDGIPTAAVGLDPVTLKLMRWAMQSWNRVSFMSRFLAGTALPQIEFDLIPGMFCGAFVIVRRDYPKGGYTPEMLLQAGGCLQRLWLTATALGLAMQPAFAPLCFAHYGRAGVPKFKKFAALVEGCIPESESILFLGRIGIPSRRPAAARSVRKSVTELIV